MAVSRGEPNAPKVGYMSAVRGRDGRTSPPPPGGLYVRDPQAARAEAIRARAALHKRRGEPIPEHLQYLLSQLPADDGVDRDVDLVDAVTGEREGEVTLVDSADAARQQLAAVSAPEPKKEPEPEVKPEATHSGVGELGAAASAVKQPETQAEKAAEEKSTLAQTPEQPETPEKPADPAAPAAPRRGRPRKAASQ